MEEKKEKYVIGLDIGTASVGWAVTDTNNNLLRYNGKNMFGIRLFETANHAAERRGFRSTRRRLARRKHRVSLLKEIFNENIIQKDPNFFKRLEESFLHYEDKEIKSKSYLFDNDIFKNDKEYFKRYPTVYDLRNHLVKSDKKEDIRLIYLAVHHIIKYRGNFLYEGTDFNLDKIDIKENFNELFDYLENQLNYEFDNSDDSIKRTIEIFKSKKTKQEKITEIVKALNVNKSSSKSMKELVRAMFNYKVSLKTIFNFDDDDIKIYLSSYEEENDKIEAALGESYDYFKILESIYQWVILKDILIEPTISESMIRKFNKHKKDLEILKKLYREHNLNKYNTMFKDDKDKTQNYNNYINNPGTVDLQSMYSTIKKDLESLKNTNNKEYENMVKDMEDRNFLPKINSIDNAVIPYQLHLNELKMILKNQGKYYDFLRYDYNKIISLVEFRVPYYVGPLNISSEYTTMVKKKANEKIYPWNFDDVVDKYASSMEFMEKRISNCTYLPQYSVMAKHSIINQMYELLSELNKIKINGVSLDFESKEKVVNHIFKKIKVVNDSTFKRELRKLGIVNNEKIEVTGYQGNNTFASSLSSYIDFADIFGDFDIFNTAIVDKYDDIILTISMIQDNDVLKENLKQKYTDIKEEQLDKLTNKKYTGFSRLSKEFIHQKIYITDESSGEIITILYQMWKTNRNLMQVITDSKLGFDKVIEENSLKKIQGKLTDEDVDEIPGSPALKKSIRQTVKIVQEIIKLMKYEPEKIYIEFSRGEEDKNRTTSRIDSMIKLYEKIKDEVSEYNKLYNDLKELKLKNEKLNNEKLFLYYLQGGKCLYTGDTIDINNLTSYDVDHIVPQYLIKDDSFNNKALVTSEANKIKGVSDVVPEEFRNKQRLVWEKLHKYGLLTSQKFYRLTRSYLNEEDIQGFINRQLVETRQIVKHTTNLLQSGYPNVEIIALRAELINNYRKKNNLYKLRNVNDLHHAHDALLCCVVGNFILNRFPKAKSQYLYNDYMKFKPSKGKEHTSGYIIGATNYKVDFKRSGFKWDPEEQLTKIKKYFQYKDCNITKKVEMQSGNFYKMKPIKKGKGDKLIPLKTKSKINLSPEKYGGYTGKQDSYYVVVSYKNKNKIKKELIGIPIYINNLIQTKQMTLESYLSNNLQLEDVKVLSKCLKYQHIISGKDEFYIVGSSERHNAKQLFIDEKYHKYIYDIHKVKDGDVLDEIYLHLTKKLKEYEIFSSIQEKLCKNYDNFKKLNVETVKDDQNKKIPGKQEVINEMLKITQCNPQNANLKAIGLTEREGRISAKINIEGITFIHHSITGLKTKRKKM